MYNIAHISKTGMQATQIRLDVISNNMVNSQTTGYKKLENSFVDTYTETLDKKSHPNNKADNVMGTGVKTSEAVRRNNQGSLKQTGIQSNLAIDGDGFFAVTTPNGEVAYTRNGEFKLDSNGRLVDDNGNFLQINYNDGTPVQDVNLANGELQITNNGEVIFDGQSIGKIELYEPQGSNDLISSGDSLFKLKEEATMNVVENSKIYQGHVEMSNVSMEQEMTNLILAQRAFQFNAKGLQAADEMWSIANNLQSGK